MILKLFFRMKANLACTYKNVNTFSNIKCTEVNQKKRMATEAYVNSHHKIISVQLGISNSFPYSQERQNLKSKSIYT